MAKDEVRNGHEAGTEAEGGAAAVGERKRVGATREAGRRDVAAAPRRPGRRPHAEAERKDTYATPALEKGLDVIELLAREPRGLTKSQVARGLNRTVSEIFRMLLCLERRGYIAQLEEDRFSLTMKLFQIVQEHPPTERLISEALPVLHEVAHETEQSCHLGVIEDGQVVIVGQVNSPSSMGFYVKLGSSVDMLRSASGHVILANQDVDARERTLAAWTRRTGQRAPAELPGHLRKIARDGYERRESYLVRGVVDLSAPILDHRGSAVAALTIPYIELNGEADGWSRAAEALRAGAKALSTALGGGAAAGAAGTPAAD